ncbi:MAG TPA: site-specific integrase [Pirellulales bacterium]|jgi:integrase|nr:site-specific integrase [Pirellulales bacterium]
MGNSTLRIPSYRRHKPSGQAVVTIAGRDIYLGSWNTATSRAEYNRIIAEWTAQGGTLPQKASSDFTITELLAAFEQYAKGYYRGPDGKPTTETANFKPIMRRLKKLYGRTPAANFGPLALKAVRQEMVGEGLSRGTVNHAVNRTRRIFKWAVENELIPPVVLQALQAVAGLRYGRSDAAETEPVRPVPDEFVEAVLPFVAPQVAAMIELQQVTGMRSGEVTIMRGADINTAGKVWVYTPQTHKTAWKGHHRQVYLGPKAQQIVKPFLKADMSAYLFSPADADAERYGQRFGVISADRKTPVYPSELRARERRRTERRRRKGGRGKRDRYTPDTYYQALMYGIEAANRARLVEAKAAGIEADQVALVPHWHPHQLRHNAATNLRREHGIEVARIILGHRSAAITEVYAEVDHARAIEVMWRIG